MDVAPSDRTEGGAGEHGTGDYVLQDTRGPAGRMVRVAGGGGESGIRGYEGVSLGVMLEACWGVEDWAPRLVMIL